MMIKKQDKSILGAIDLSVLGKTYENKWVALSADYKKILAVGDKLIDVLTTKEPGKIVMKVLPQLGYAPRAI